MKSRYGLIGYPLSHSFSKNYFSQKFRDNSIDATYDLFPLEEIRSLLDILKTEQGLLGLNVTIPYKQQVISMLDQISDDAAAMNSVNVIKIKKGDNHFILEGYNTDAPAFESEIIDFAGNQPGNALILGTGGASASVAYVLRKLGWEILFISRFPNSHSNALNYHEINESVMLQTRLIVNTTPLGMYPEVDNFPAIPYHFITSKHYLFDLVYNPEITSFLLKGSKKGAHIKNGLGMLYKQAELAWEIWQK
ncbi:MAG: shikimate dehydrogenase family protein [Methanococcaceae archaeon]